MRFPLLDSYLNRSMGPGHTVEYVDLERYAGRWYEIASIPTWFEDGCRCTVMEYVYRNGVFLINNFCQKDGKPLWGRSNASPVPGTNNSQLEISFEWPTKGDYWIIALDEDYQYSMVGHPTRDYLWILSRDPYMDEETYRSLVQIASEKGYEVEKLQKNDLSCYVHLQSAGMHEGERETGHEHGFRQSAPGGENLHSV